MRSATHREDNRRVNTFLINLYKFNNTPFNKIHLIIVTCLRKLPYLDLQFVYVSNMFTFTECFRNAGKTCHLLQY